MARPPPASLLAAVLLLLLVGSVAGQRWKDNLGPCYRDCTEDPEPRICYYEFVEDIYAVLTSACANCSSGRESQCYQEECIAADGVARSIYSINRQMPGPDIHVCVGDRIIVDLHVQLPGHAEAIHWHGLPQEATPWFDGVAWVTQCPIIYGNTFRYDFLAEPGGTYFYHSHSGLHKVNGIVGSLIIRESKECDTHADLYDVDEHVMLLQDWMHVPAEFVMPGLSSRITGQPADTLLINGQGRFTNSANRTTHTPLAKFEVEPGTRYRFRIINAGSLSCPIQVQFEGHNMTVISADGLNIKPQRANSLVTYSGERWDVVITTYSKPTTTVFWIYIRTVGFCTNSGTTEQVALLVYRGNKLTKPPTTQPGIHLGRQLVTGTVVNPPGDCESKSQVCASELSALTPPEGYSTQPRSKGHKLLLFKLKFTLLPIAELFGGEEDDVFPRFLAFGQANLASTLNGISYKEPSAPFLTQPGESSTPYCNEDRIPKSCSNSSACDCPHWVKVPYGKVIDVIVVDDTDIDEDDNSTTLLAHPMHLHGTSFSCMGMGTLRNITSGAERSEHVRDLYTRRRLPTSVSHPALKDVLVLPGGGWIWFRFLASNRGCWFFHCHFQYHMAAGMEVVVQVGESKSLPKPPSNFPKCGDYVPSGSDDYYWKK